VTNPGETQMGAGARSAADAALFEGFTAAERDAIGRAAANVVAGPGEVVVREGEVSDRLYLLLCGRVRVSKAAADGEFVIGEVGPGELLGEVAAFDRQPRSATAVALERTELAVFPIDSLRGSADLRAAYDALVCVSLGGATSRLRRSTDAVVEALRRELEHSRDRIAMGVFMVDMLTVISVYALSLRTMAALNHPVYGARVVSVVALFAIALAAVLTMWRSGFPFATYGLRLDGWRRHSVDAVLWTAPFLALLTLLKWVGIQVLPQLRDEAVFNPARPFMRDGAVRMDLFLLAFLAYVVLCPVQELVTRGSCQTSLYRFLSGSEQKRQWVSIIVTNLFFATAHSHLSFRFVTMVFVPGLLWGWIYGRQGTLVGATVSHVLLGSWLLFVLGTGGLV